VLCKAPFEVLLQLAASCLGFFVGTKRIVAEFLGQLLVPGRVFLPNRFDLVQLGFFANCFHQLSGCPERLLSLVP
jgi:hypothetical protein